MKHVKTLGSHKKIMAKYYVQSGELNEVVTAESPIESAWQAILRASGQIIGEFFKIDERGFRETSKWTIPYGEIVIENHQKGQENEN